MADPLHGVIVLAAGESRRLGQAKQLVRHAHESLVHRAARLALGTQAHDAVVVLGHAADAVFDEVKALPIRRVDCANWRHGMGASLRSGVDALDARCSGVLVVLCDQPHLSLAHLLALRLAWQRAPTRGAASFYANKPGVPALLPRTWFDALDTRGDRGMREVLMQRAEFIDAVADESLAFDLDHADDLLSLRAH